MKPGKIVEGKGSSVVPLACGALVRLVVSGEFSVLVGSRAIVTSVFKLPADQDSVELIARKSDSIWRLEWWPIKPGFELPDPTPVTLPVGSHRPESIDQTIARLVRREVSNIAGNEGFDREEEEDFSDDGDFDDVPSPYEFEEHGIRAEREQQRLAKLGQWLEKKRKGKPAPPPPPAEPEVQQAPKTAQSA